MKILVSVFFFVALSIHTDAQMPKGIQLTTSTAIDAHFPLSLDKLYGQENREIVSLDLAGIRKITSIVSSYYFQECGGDADQTYFSMQDVYINTIQLHDSLVTIYLVLLKHMPGNEVNGKIIFYDNNTKAFLDTAFDFNIHALYEYRNRKIHPTNLKHDFNITAPEIERIDYNKDGINDFKFTRLYHNGTSNATETFILKVSGNKVEQLNFEKAWLKWRKV